MTRRAIDRGYSLVELAISLAILLVVCGVFFQFVATAFDVFERELEIGDMHQRARVSLDAMFRDIVAAGSTPAVPAVAPYRRGLVNPDLNGTAFGDRVSVVPVAPHGAVEAAPPVTYWLRTGSGEDQPQLMRYDGETSDLPLADYVRGLRVEYFAADGLPLPIARFEDGPWFPDAVSPGRFDLTLHEVRRVRVVVRIRPARVFLRRPLSDHEAAVDIAPRRVGG